MGEFTQRDNDIILAALRLYQGRLEGRATDVDDVEEIATDSDPKPPTADEIDEILSRLFNVH